MLQGNHTANNVGPTCSILFDVSKHPDSSPSLKHNPRHKSNKNEKLYSEQQKTVSLVSDPSPIQYGTDPNDRKERSSPAEPFSGFVRLFKVSIDTFP